MYIKNKQKGFTLIELIVVVGIFLVLTAVVVFNYNKFSNDTILTNMAYEMALSYRQAQVFGVAAVGDTGDFGKAYGISIYAPVGDQKRYRLFVDQDQDGLYDAGASPSELIEEYTLQRDVVISGLADSLGGSCNVLTSNLMNVLFLRPSQTALVNGASNRDFGEIELSNSQGTKRYVRILNNGQVYVTDTATCL